MLEIHLFVNPLGIGCINCEDSLVSVDHEISTKISYQFVPLLNMSTIADTAAAFSRDDHSLARRNHTAEVLMQVTLDYEAALFQGRRRGRLYLLQLQRALLQAPQQYSCHFAQQIAAQTRLDIDMFLEDRQSPLARQSFKKHQQLAFSLGVLAPSTAVVVDTNDPQYSLLVDHFDMKTLVDAYQHHQLDQQMSPVDLAHQLNVFSYLNNKHN